MLAAAITATWLGQDGTDLAGGATPLAGNGVQDMHIRLGNIPAGRTIATVDVIGDGGGEWKTNLGPYSIYNGALVQAPGATTADLDLDPYQVETGRKFFITMTLDDGTSDFIIMRGGTADPNLRTPHSALAATWVGQDGEDQTGATVGVGPDGFQDVKITLANLFPGTAVASVAVTAAGEQGWASGPNPDLLDHAEFTPDPADPTRGSLRFSPSDDLDGKTLNVLLTYADGKTVRTTLAAGHTNPNLVEPLATPPAVTWGGFQATWIGQDGTPLGGLGSVHLAVSGLPAGRNVVSATLSDQAGLDWSYSATPGGTLAVPGPSSLAFARDVDPSRAEVGFAPGRSEVGATLTMVLTLDDGSRIAAHLIGGAADPGLRQPGPVTTSVVAHPGDDLNALANEYGTVRLAPGLYPLDAPLVLTRPVAITTQPGATLLFTQPADAPTWTAAIKVLASHTTLDGFAVRFAGPVRWTAGVAYGPAVIGAADNFDAPTTDPRLGLTFTHLDLQTPPPATAWEEAPQLLRLANASSGAISGNRLKGGATEFFGGPWRVTGNDFLGTVAGTYTYNAFAAHYSHDVVISGNTVAPTGNSGKTWRFLVMTQSGVDDVVLNNRVTGVGPTDADTVVDPNAPEVILTESYKLHEEGSAIRVSADGLVIQVPPAPGGSARTGDVLAILSGPQAGQWRLIAQALGPDTYLLDSPVTPGSFAYSIATGFVNETYQGNTIDSRGSSTADDLVLAGDQFGAKVIGNTFLGGNQAFRIEAYPSEAPEQWGWTHAPFLGAAIQGNTVIDTISGGLLDVEHDAYSETNAGRVYFSGSFTGNTGIWDAGFLAARAKLGVASPPTLVTVGDALSNDPGEILLRSSGNTVQGPAWVVAGPTFNVISGTVNGLTERDDSSTLPGSTPRAAVTTAASPPTTVTPSTAVPTATPTATPPRTVSVHSVTASDLTTIQSTTRVSEPTPTPLVVTPAVPSARAPVVSASITAVRLAATVVTLTRPFAADKATAVKAKESAAVPIIRPAAGSDAVATVLAASRQVVPGRRSDQSLEPTTAVRPLVFYRQVHPRGPRRRVAVADHRQGTVVSAAQPRTVSAVDLQTAHPGRDEAGHRTVV